MAKYVAAGQEHMALKQLGLASTEGMVLQASRDIHVYIIGVKKKPVH
ncbi:hypothetical protein [Umezawaea sp. Da 62-37]|nr:hypothetical protein [Umezawaea sp. Da 62-37]WNV83854.1 hypothetical protein RM788_37620 [Umezawaea sp. Da 62-37]